MSAVISDLAARIDAGEFDAELTELEEAIRMRQASVRSSRKKTDFNVGDRVRFNSMCGTKYIIGQTATVVRPRRTKLVVILDRPIGRFAKRAPDGTLTAAEVVVPATILDPA